jgi:phage baseplate assembly protein V
MDNIKGVLRVGKISAVYPEKATARVVFEAHNLVSYELSVLQTQTLKNRAYWMPDVGEYVLCAFLPTGNASGFVLGSLYSANNEPDLKTNDKRAMLFDDGTYIEYDRAQHLLTVDVPSGVVNINVNGPVNIAATGNVNVTGDVIADGISLKNHVHPENDSGGPTDPPQ